MKTFAVFLLRTQFEGVCRKTTKRFYQGGGGKVRTFIIGVSLALALLTGPASAEPSADDMSANDVMPGCRSLLGKARTKPHFDAAKSANKEEIPCIGGVTAAEMIDDLQQKHEVCIPKGVTMGQMIAVVVKYVDEHPEDMHSEFLFLAHEALLTAWPCKP
jgi:hypothetical protein